jgi:aminopeptidase N
MKKNTIPLLFTFVSITCFCQVFTKQDTLRGSITPERAWWDLIHYDLEVEVFPDTKTIKGVNTITYTGIDKGEIMQIDLQKPMKINQIIQNNKKLEFTSEGLAHFIKLQDIQNKGSENRITVYFSGKPQEAKNAPWDGGFSWKKDNNGNHFIATSNQGIGASIWWPNKDHYYDEPDKGVKISVTIPKDLMDVSNGRLTEVIDNGRTKTWIWEVKNPINNYGVNINIGDYVHFGDKYQGLRGHLDMDYYVLRENIEKAREQFLQAPMMMKAFEYWFGPYPFYEDSFKLVEVPYLGMEHQSSITYGNNYQNGYLGRDLSNTGWGLKFDFILIHESGHEWFANNITNIDPADMWIHESFTAYSENLYLDYHYGKKAASEYLIGTRRLIQNNHPIIGPYEVNYSGDTDMYYKGSNILHTLRQLLADDEKWRTILNGLTEEFYHQTVSTHQIESYINQNCKFDLSEFWDQYLRTVRIPRIEYKVNGKRLEFKYVNVVEDFDMPVVVIINQKEEWIHPTLAWKTVVFKNEIERIKIKEDFYVEMEEF